jgi:signal transduction histidine kinase
MAATGELAHCATMVTRLTVNDGTSLLERSAEAATAALMTAAEGMLSRVELVLADHSLPADARGLLSGAERDGRRLRAVVEDIRDLALGDNPRGLDLDLVDVSPIAHEALQLLWPRAFPTGRRFDLRAAMETWVVVDGARIGKALRRILERAVETSAPGSTILVEIDSRGFAVSFETDAEEASHDPLGLALAESIARAHGGGLSLADDGVRTTITLSLAASAVPADAV